ncbi:MAG TPA: hypothetical protein VLW52_05110 [Opitutaceae bacterium]|nr:hypothetical protein [Opitutaceae bacterium]
MHFTIPLVLFFLVVPWFPISAAERPASAVPARPENQIQADLEQNLQTARWMVEYDHVAWATTDLLLKESKETLRQVGPVWFCLKKDDGWYALYGSLRAETYDIAVCYREASRDKFEKVTPPDFPDKDRFARAISLTLPETLETTRRTTVRFNYFVRGERDQIAIYYLPAFQTDGKLAYGIQYTFFLDSPGRKLTSHEQLGQVLIGVFPNKGRTVVLEMPECVVPTPQALFSMISYRDRFGDIVTHCRDGYFGITEQNGVLTCIRKSATPSTAPEPPLGMNGTAVSPARSP